MEKLSGSYEALVQRRYVEQIKHLLRLCFRRSFEGGSSPPRFKGGDPSQSQLGVTLFGKGVSPFPTFPQSRKVVFGWSWRRA